MDVRQIVCARSPLARFVGYGERGERAARSSSGSEHKLRKNDKSKSKRKRKMRIEVNRGPGEIENVERYGFTYAESLLDFGIFSSYSAALDVQVLMLAVGSTAYAFFSGKNSPRSVCEGEIGARFRREKCKRNTQLSKDTRLARIDIDLIFIRGTVCSLAKNFRQSSIVSGILVGPEKW